MCSHFLYIVRWQVANEVCAIIPTSNRQRIGHTPRVGWNSRHSRLTGKSTALHQIASKVTFFALCAADLYMRYVIVYPSIRLIFLTAPRWMENEHRVCLNSLSIEEKSRVVKPEPIIGYG